MRLRQECGAQAPDHWRWLPVSVSRFGQSAWVTRTYIRGAEGDTGRAHPSSARTLTFPILPGQTKLRRRTFPRWTGRGRIGLALPPPRSAPPPQVDGSSSWDSSGARRQLRAADSGRNARPSARPRTCRRRLPRPPVYPGPLRRGVAARAPPPGLGPGTLLPASAPAANGAGGVSGGGQRSAPPLPRR